MIENTVKEKECDRECDRGRFSVTKKPRPQKNVTENRPLSHTLSHIALIEFLAGIYAFAQFVALDL